MTETSLGLTALSTTLSLVGLWALFQWLYRDYRVDLFRERLFALRDRLFEVAASGKIAFDDPAYGSLRSMLNGYIRFAHRVSFPLLIFASRRTQVLTRGTEQVNALRAAVRAQPPETREALDGILNQMHWYVLDQVILTSLLMWLVIVPVVVYALMHTLGEKVLRFVRTWRVWRWLKTHVLEPMDSAALTVAG